MHPFLPQLLFAIDGHYRIEVHYFLKIYNLINSAFVNIFIITVFDIVEYFLFYLVLYFCLRKGHQNYFNLVGIFINALKFDLLAYALNLCIVLCVKFIQNA